MISNQVRILQDKPIVLIQIIELIPNIQKQTIYDHDMKTVRTPSNKPTHTQTHARTHARAPPPHKYIYIYIYIYINQALKDTYTSTCR